MQNDYRDAILSMINRYRSLIPVLIIKARFPDQPDLSAIHIGPYTAGTFLTIGNQVIESLEAAINSPTWPSLTASFQGHNDFGQVDLNGTLSSYVNFLVQKDLEQASQQLSRLVWYCMATGIWTDEKNVKPPTRSQVKLIADELSLSSKRLGDQLVSIEQATNELAERRQDLVNFTDEKKSELSDIRRGLEEARQHLNALQSILEQATTKNNEISTIKDDAQNVLGEMNIQLGVLMKTYDTFKSDSEKQKVDTKDALEDSKVALQESDKLYKEILGYRDTIKHYVGMSVDGYLGNKFDARSVRMRWGLYIWASAIPLAVAVAIGWAVYVFQHFNTQAGVDWLSFFINLVKTSPAFILLGFVFSQYSKERNLREEYAFRGAVAMTVNTYADLLAGKDSPENSSRQNLILNALKQVHSQPKLYGERSGRLGNVKAQEIRDTITALNETLKNLKGS